MRLGRIVATGLTVGLAVGAVALPASASALDLSLGLGLATPVVTVGASVSASAGLPTLPAVGSACAPGTPAPSLSQALSCGPGNALDSLLCPIASKLPPNIPGVNQVSSVACALGALDYAYVTVYTGPDGTQVRRITHALAELPTPIDVNGDGVPDFIGTLGVTADLHGLTLRIDRVSSSTSAWPVSIEAVANNPVAAHSFVGFGYDGRVAGTPSSFSATLSLVSFTSSNSEIGLSVTNSAAPSTLGLMGEQFQGNPDSPSNVERGLIAFTPVPATLTADVKLAASHDEVSLESSTASVVAAKLALISPGEEQDFHGLIDKLPTSVDVAYDSSGGHSTVKYTGSAPIGLLGATYHDHLNGSIASAAALDARAVPTGVTVDQQGSQTTLTTQGGPIGSLEVRYGSGSDVAPVGAGSGAYLAYHHRATATTAGARVLNLASLSVNAADPYSADLKLSQPLSRVDMSMIDDTLGLTVAGALSNLPAHTTATFSPTAGKVTFDGHGTGIDEITVDARKTTPFFGRVRHFNADLHGIPASLNVSFTQGDGKFGATLDHPIGEVDLAADDGHTTTSVFGADAGLSYTDLPGRCVPGGGCLQAPQFALAARVYGLTGIGFESDPLHVDLHSAGGHVFYLVAHVAPSGNGIFAVAQINKVPSDVAMTLNQPSDWGAPKTTVEYTASAPIDYISVDANADNPFFGQATHIHAELHGIPAAFYLNLEDPTDSFTLTLDHPIGEVDLTADDGAHHPIVPGSDSGVFYHSVPGDYALRAHVFGPSKLTFQSSASPAGATSMSGEVKSAGGHVFDVDALVPFVGQNATLTGEIDKLPADVTFTYNNDDSGTTVDYRGFDVGGQGQRINRIELALIGAAGGVPFFQRAHYVYGKVLGMPSHVHIAMPNVPPRNVNSLPVFKFDAGGETLDKVEFQALDVARALVPFPQRDGSTSLDADGIVYHDLWNSDGTPGEFTLAGQLSGLRTAAIQTSPSVHARVDVDPALARAFGIDVQTQTENTEVQQIAPPNQCNRFFELNWNGSENSTDHTALFDCPGPSADGITAADVQQGLVRLDGIGRDAAGRPNLSASGGPLTTKPITVTFQNDLAHKSEPLMRFFTEDGLGNFVQAGLITELTHGGGPPSPVTYYTGYIDKLPPNLVLDVGLGNTQQIHYSADAPISELALDTNAGAPGAPLIHLDLQNIPTSLDICSGTDVDARPCLLSRPLPSSYDSAGATNTGHLAAVNIDDHGTSPDSSPLNINAYICTVPDNNGNCSIDAANSYLSVDNLQIHNLLVDTNAFTCGGTDLQLLLCGHLSIDTRGRPATGTVTYVDGSISHLNFIKAAFHPGAGFSANLAYTDWTDQPSGDEFGGDDNTTGVPTFHQFGSVNCAPGTYLNVGLGLLGGAVQTTNYAPEYLCS